MEPAHPKVARPSFCLHPASALSAASSYVLRTERGRDSVVSARIEAPTARIAVAAGAATVTGFWVAAARARCLAGLDRLRIAGTARLGSGPLRVDDPGNSRARHGDVGRDNHPLNSDWPALMLGVHCRERKAADRRHCNETCCRRMTANKNARAGCSARLGLKELVTDHRRIVGDLASRCVRDQITHRDQCWSNFWCVSIRLMLARTASRPWGRPPRRSGLRRKAASHSRDRSRRFSCVRWGPP